ncbi:DUF961 family protein [Bacillus altitudinis]|uniref:DUF961 family protein n=1 Tax=Bacillus TaxID=1386 RepID=UPI000C77E4D2|nr:DUF961 family protein [Bacillus safensis]PLT37693.1 hypothetical protein CUU65_12605 [Bacillus safensis]
MKFNFIVPNEEMTFGKLRFMGLNRERYTYVDGKRTDTIESRVYNIASSVQGGQVEVTLPGHIEPKDFTDFVEVDLVEPKITAMAMSSGNFASVTWKVEAADILLKGSSSKAAVTANNEKK